jgi:hypothetical protein
MHCISFGRLRGTDDRVDVQVAVTRRRRADANRAVRLGDMRCVGIGIRINRHRLDPELPACPNNAVGDLSTIGY